MSMNLSEIFVTAVLFVVLSPGLLVSIPPAKKHNAAAGDAAVFVAPGTATFTAAVVHGLLFAVLIKYVLTYAGVESK